jgi:3-oxoacyl-[acyl-carrier protein] reductase
MPDHHRLNDLVAWVTGSSRGLGRVMATELCRMGASVAVHGTRFDSPKSFGEGESMEQVARDIETDAANDPASEGSVSSGATNPSRAVLQQPPVGTAMPVWGDVTSETEVKRMAGEIRKRFGRIDILVNNAGGDIGAGGTSVGKGGRPDPDDCIEIPLADVKAVLDRNLLSCILCCREVAPEMMVRRNGRIITIGSIAGTYGRDEGAIYAVAKAAVHQYTRCLATQLRPHNVTVNCVAPGGTVTNRFLVIHKIDENKLVEAGTLDRYGRPQEIASTVGFLASQAAGFISGQIIRVDGGSQCWPA